MITLFGILDTQILITLFGILDLRILIILFGILDLWIMITLFGILDLQILITLFGIFKLFLQHFIIKTSISYISICCYKELMFYKHYRPSFRYYIDIYPLNYLHIMTYFVNITT
jgi:hypothetical protein